MKKRILITGAGGNAAVGFCRSLHKSKGFYYLVGTDIDPYNILFAETERKYLVPKADSKSYLKVLNIIIKKNKIEFLHAQADKEIAVLSESREKIRARTFLPKKETIKIAQNKLETQKILAKNRVPVPPSILINNFKDIKKAFLSLGQEVWFRAIKGAGGKGSLLIGNPNIAASWVTYWKGYGNFMACKYLPGKNLGWDSVWLKGKLVISHTKERMSYALASSSPSGISGTAGLIRSVIRPEVDKIAKAAILSVDPEPEGIFSVDLKEDKKGNAFVTEINPGRFLTSSLHFFAETGYSLPTVYINLAYREKANLRLKLPVKKYLVRTLDSKPILFSAAYVRRISKLLSKKEFIELT